MGLVTVVTKRNFLGRVVEETVQYNWTEFAKMFAVITVASLATAITVDIGCEVYDMTKKAGRAALQRHVAAKAAAKATAAD